MSNIENGHDAYPVTVRKLAAALGVETRQIIEEEGNGVGKVTSSDVVCAACGAEARDRQPGSPCPDCGGCGRLYRLTIESELKPHSLLVGKARHGGRGKPFAEFKSGGEIHRDTGQWRHVLRSLNRVTDTYDERIVDEAGTVVREVHEPLSHHRGRGSAPGARRGSD